MSIRPFIDAYDTVYKNSIFEKYKDFENLKPSDITPEKIKILEELKSKAGYAHDFAVDGLRGIGELMRMAFSESNLSSDEAISDDLWRVGELIVHLTDIIEQFDISQYELGGVLKDIDDFKTGVSKPVN